MMRGPLAWLVFAIASALSATSAAAPIDIFVVVMTPAGFPTNQFQISASPSPDVGNLSLHVVGFTGMTLAPLPQISVLDSPFVGNQFGATVQITSLVGQNLVPQTGGPTDRTVLATLTAVVLGDRVIRSGDDLFGFTAVNRALTEPIPYRLWVDYDTHGPVLVDSWLPEPATSALLGVGLVALALARRARAA